MVDQGMNMSRTSGQNVTPLLVSPREAARLLSICERTLYTLTLAGEIPVIRRGRLVRYALDDLRAWIKKSAERA